MDRETSRKIFKERGVKPLPPDDPIYSEGPSVYFIRRLNRQTLDAVNGGSKQSTESKDENQKGEDHA